MSREDLHKSKLNVPIVDDLIRSPDDVKEQYAYIMSTWRLIHIILDGITSKSSQEDPKAALERISALLASSPSWQIK
jgi:hypothetical protein